MKYENVSEDTELLFRERINQYHLDGLQWSVMGAELKKSKDNMCGKVHINPEAARQAYGEDVIFIINEDVFDRLKEEHQLVFIDKLIAQVGYDLEKDKIKKSEPDVKEHSGMLLKYGYDTLSTVSSEISRIYGELKEDKQKNNGKDE